MKNKLLATQDKLIATQDWLIKLLLEQIEYYKRLLAETQERA